MSVIALILLVALLVPILAIVIDSPIGRALARRLEGPAAISAGDVGELAKKVDLLEAEVDDLNRAVADLREENQFLQRLIEAPPRPDPTLPPPAAP